jgi:hypothetical protein
MSTLGDLALETMADVGLCLQARAIRAEFEANRNIVSGLMLAFRLPNLILFTGQLFLAPQANREAAQRMLTHGEQLLAEWKHPDPLVREYPMPGTGSS